MPERKTGDFPGFSWIATHELGGNAPTRGGIVPSEESQSYGRIDPVSSIGSTIPVFWYPAAGGPNDRKRLCLAQFLQKLKVRRPENA